jgi:pimeloyl-ACP methyl ester carboxylesterase
LLVKATLNGKSPNAPDTWSSGAYGHYDYTEILTALASSGFVVISEIRASDQTWTNAIPYVTFYAQRAAQQVAALLAAGVPQDRIVVAGFSQGAYIAQLTGTLTNAQNARFVIMAGCAPPTTSQSSTRTMSYVSDGAPALPPKRAECSRSCVSRRQA